jgi:ribonucleoside-diphosphate reductase alpha chain
MKSDPRTATRVGKPYWNDPAAADGWSEEALRLLYDRYLGMSVGADRPAGTVAEWLWCVCSSLCASYPEAERDLQTQRYFDLLYCRRFLPTTATLVNACGGGGLSGCLVLPVPPDTQSLFSTTLPDIARALQYGTGVGLDISVVPPRLARIGLGPSKQRESGPGSAQLSPGPVEVLTSLATALDAPIAYTGVKRAALMGSLFIAHPDIFEFIAAKRSRYLPTINLSVSVDGPFLTALRRGGLCELEWQPGGSSDGPCSSSAGTAVLLRSDLELMALDARGRGLPGPDLYLDNEGHLYSRASGGRRVGCSIGERILVDARLLWQLLAEAIRDCGEPGLLNLAAIEDANPTRLDLSPFSDTAPPGFGYLRTTAPCGEQPLLPYEVCQLGSLNLPAFLSVGGELDEAALEEAVWLAVRLLDDVIDVADLSVYGAACPAVVTANRKIGLGIMGLADVLAEWDLPYDTEAAREAAVGILRRVRHAAEAASEELGRERGAFPNACLLRDHSTTRRNATVLSLPPTGSISILAGCSPSIEPYFTLGYWQQSGIERRFRRFAVLDRKLRSINYSLEEWIKATKAVDPDYEFDGTLRGLRVDILPEPDRRIQLERLGEVFKTAREIRPSDHVQMVAALQPYVDNGISKTINLPLNTTVEEIEQLLMKALEAGLKGITLFPDHPLLTPALQPGLAEAYRTRGDSIEQH